MHYFHITKPVSLTHENTTRKFNGVTFCWDYNEHMKRVEYSMALCSFKDNFSRKIGRVIAEGRKAKGISGEIYMEPADPAYHRPKYRDVMDALVNEFKVTQLCQD